MEPFFINEFFLDFILPFVLVFTLIFAILQKTELLGKGKKQNDSLVSLVIGLILIAFPFSRNLVVQLMPFLAVSIVILLVFMLGYGFIYQGQTDMHKYLKATLVIIFGLALLTAILIITGSWDVIYSLFFKGEEFKQIGVGIILVIIIAATIIAVLKGKSDGEG